MCPNLTWLTFLVDKSVGLQNAILRFTPAIAQGRHGLTAGYRLNLFCLLRGSMPAGLSPSLAQRRKAKPGTSACFRCAVLPPTRKSARPTDTLNRQCRVKWGLLDAAVPPRMYQYCDIGVPIGRTGIGSTKIKVEKYSVMAS